MGAFFGVLTLAASVLQLTTGLWLPALLTFVAVGQSAVLYVQARRGRMAGAGVYATVLPLTLIPTALFVVSHFSLPGGAATFITGPFSNLYFVMIILTGFVFEPRLSYLAGLLSGAGYVVSYLLARSHLASLQAPDPAMLQDLTNPMLYVFKAVMMVAAGLMVGRVSLIARRLLLDVFREEHEKLVVLGTFGMIVDPRVRDEMVRGSIELGGEERETTVFFADIRGFTSFAQGMKPRALLEFMREYFDLVNARIQEEDGTIMEYVGDEVMALFGAPLALPDHARRGCRAAVATQRALQRQREIWKAVGKPEVVAGVGIHAGQMLVGNIGSTDRCKYGAIGDNVNVGSRIQALTKEYRVAILASEEAVRLAGDAIHAREIDRVPIRGRTTEITIYEVVALGEERMPLAWHELQTAYQAGLAAYREGDLDKAQGHFEQCLVAQPGDGPSAVFLERIQARIEAASR